MSSAILGGFWGIGRTFSPGFILFISFVRLLFSDFMCFSTSVTLSVFHSLFHCWIFCLSPYSFSFLPVFSNLQVQNSCVLFPYVLFFSSFMLLNNLNHPLFTFFSSVLTTYLVCPSIIFCTSKYVFSHFCLPCLIFIPFMLQYAVCPFPFSPISRCCSLYCCVIFL